MKTILSAMQTIIKVVFPDSKWANIVYLILGIIISQFDSIESIVKAIMGVFK
jgi:hypothetical protein